MENAPVPEDVGVYDLADVPSVIACASLAAGGAVPEPTPAYRRVDVDTL